MMKKAIIVGASSGIGKSLAQILARDGYRVGLAARRLPLLLDLQKMIGNQALVNRLTSRIAPMQSFDFLNLSKKWMALISLSSVRVLVL